MHFHTLATVKSLACIFLHRLCLCGRSIEKANLARWWWVFLRKFISNGSKATCMTVLYREGSCFQRSLSESFTNLIVHFHFFSKIGSPFTPFHRSFISYYFSLKGVTHSCSFSMFRPRIYMPPSASS